MRASIIAGSFLLLACSAKLPEGYEDAVEQDAENEIQRVFDEISKGVSDRGRHPSVFAIVAEDNGHSTLCSGTLIHPQWVLTARHCVVSNVPNRLLCPSPYPVYYPVKSASKFRLYASDDVASSEPIAYAKAIITLQSDSLCEHDLALIKLSKSIHSIAPMGISRSNAVKPGRTISSVGYGQQGSRGAMGVRMFRSNVKILEVDQSQFSVGNSICGGDSGGPAIDEQTGLLLGVASRGTSNCSSTQAENIYMQVINDLSWIESVIGHSISSSSIPSEEQQLDLGEQCQSSGDCSSGVCLETKSEIYCSRRCSGEFGRCPKGFLCTKQKDSTAYCLKKQ